ncbi:hypothetical protein [Paenibacillus tyrfis]|uniref:Uncharacterized protein n=1 Tax=Paenibacillus tyrfis TaxID=1501230 RepID=A0A081NV38_9BACL|nr:hypothetical protein [Paenibacillus tyrfis]KEQ22311.1 hypothetical protein ET33_26435 [Paenibacillus tyrfis]
MKFQVNKGYVKHEGVFHSKGSFFDASPDDMEELLQNGTVAVYSETFGTDNYVAPADDDEALGGAEADGHDDLVPAFHADDVIVDAAAGSAPKRSRK